MRADSIRQFLDTRLKHYEMFPLAGDASFRRYIRVQSQGRSFMLMDAPPEKEDVRPFMAIATALHQAGFSAPSIIASDERQGLLLLEDLGDDTYSRLLRADITPEREYYQAAVEVLASWHSGKLTPNMLTLPRYDETLLMREVGLFPNWFLPQIMDGSELKEAQETYLALWKILLREAPLATDQFVHRDYHADNLMWLADRTGTSRVGLLDFQDAVWGDAAYDMVSLLEDARRDVAPALAEDMIFYYLSLTGCDKERFRHAHALLAAQRNSKIVGIFTRLAARDSKAHYLNYLPRVWAHLTNDAAHPKLAMLKTWIDRHVPVHQRGVISIRKDAKALGLAA